MNLTIVTINYNSSENTIKLLESLKNQTDKGFDIIIVDNNSDPEQKAILKNYQTEETNVVFMENQQNLGYSGGNNVGIRKALENGSEWALLLNNDTWVETDFISLLRANLEGKEGIAGLAIREGEKTAYAGKIEWLKPTLPHIYDKASSYKLKGGNSYVIGGALAIHKSVFGKIGFLDENYFLYFEDADFSMRARGAGVRIDFIDEPKISHAVSSSTKKLGAPTLLRYHFRNALYFNLLHAPAEIKILLPFWSFWIILKQVIKIAGNNNGAESLAILKGILDFHLGNMGKIKTGP